MVKSITIILRLLLLLVVGLIFLFAFSSCTSYKRCTELYGVVSKDTLYICVEKEVPYIVTVPADSAKAEIGIDKLLQGDTLKTVPVAGSKDTTISIKAWIDPTTNTLKVEAFSKQKEMKGTAKIKEKIALPPKLYLEKPQRFKDKVIALYTTVSRWSFPFLLLFFIYVFTTFIRQWTQRKYFS